MKNLELWDKFKETDPRYTKSFKRGGGFSGTATDPMYIVMRMTQEFGPNGIGWGWEIVDEDYVKGAPLKKDPTANTIIHKIQLRLWYMAPVFNESMESDVMTKFYSSPQFGLTTFVGEYSTAGVYTDEEHAKKSVTDAISKCAVQLGIAADIHMGKYDDNKYVKSLEAKFSGETPTQPKDTPKAGEDDIPLGGGHDKIDEKQRERIINIGRKNGWPDADMKILVAKHGFESTADVTETEYKKIVATLSKKLRMFNSPHGGSVKTLVNERW